MSYARLVSPLVLAAVLFWHPAAHAASKGPELTAGSMELMGSAYLQLTDPVTLYAGADFGYFVHPMHEVGASASFGLGDNVSSMAIGPFYRFNMQLGPDSIIVPFAGGGLGLGMLSFSNRRGSNTDSYTQIMLNGGVRFMLGEDWALPLQLLFVHTINNGRGDSTVQLTAGFTIFL